MPYRQTPLVTGETYHLFNRSVGQLPIFVQKRDCQRAIKTLEFYLYQEPPLRFSHYDRLAINEKANFLTSLRHRSKYISLFTFTLMPNHFHLLAREEIQNGISIFMRNFQNSIARYHNIKNKRHGAVLQSMFKVARIENNNQLLHVQRYIHLNPITSYILKDENELAQYPWSSYPLYLNNQENSFVNRYLILNQFKSIEKFRQFTTDQIDYQRQLNQIKHLTLE